MAFTDEYYRAYREFRDTVSQLPEYRKHLSALRAADPGTDVHNGSERRCLIDMEWVETIEKTLPSIDKAIRENRRFIAVEDEVVPIEKSRRITTESVRHLAQHTNLISRVEGDFVTPERILNIRREESFAVYENRFLVLLLNTALHFVESRFSAVRSGTNKSLSHVVLKREAAEEEEKVRFTLDYYSEYNEDTSFEVNADVSTMTDFARLQRVRAILSAFAASPLIRSLQGVEPVRPPITHTNVLMKDPDFHACLELWVYLEGYDKDGFRIEQEEAEGIMEPLLQENVEAAMDTVGFVVRTMSNEATAEALEKTYQEDKQRRAAEAERLERERREAEEARLLAAVEAERAVQEEKLRAAKEKYETQLSELKVGYEDKISQLTQDYEQKLSRQREECRQVLAEQKAEYEAHIEALTADYERQLAEMKAQYEERITELVNRYETRIAEEQEAREQQVQELTEGYEDKLQVQQSAYETRIAAINENHTREKNEALKQHETQLGALAQQYRTELADQKVSYEKTLAEERNAHRETVNDMKSRYESEKKQLSKDMSAAIEKEKNEAAESLKSLRSQFAAEKEALLLEQDEILLDRQMLWSADRADLTDRLNAEKERNTALNSKEAALRKELEALNALMSKERRSQEKREKIHEKELQRLQAKLDSVSRSGEEQRRKQEERYQKQIRRLKRQLEKALRKCPQAEVLAEDEEGA